MTTTAKHTPGPWTIRGTDTLYQVMAGEMKIVSTSWHSHFRNPYPLKREALANAQLCAAAPEMLEALKMVSQCLKDGAPVRCGGYVNAAIAKAEGKS